MFFDSSLLTELKNEIKYVDYPLVPQGKIISLGKFATTFNGDFHYFETSTGETLLFLYDKGKYYSQIGSEIPLEDIENGRFKLKKTTLELQHKSTQLLDIITHMYFYIQRRVENVAC